ncbi:MAG: SDR family oxidoreductase [Actinomycetota bacterium]|nr:SDR family oxidoreductase [Actinomycetota bacterium]
MDLRIAGRVALVTAASKGLGRASALALAEEGAKVAICARGRKALGEAEAEIAAHAEVLAVPVDVTDPAVPAALVAEVVERFGRLDILVANAGGPQPGRSLDFDDEAIDEALGANLFTSIRLIRSAVPHMRAGGWGRICLITSSSIKQPIPTLALSNTARTGLWAWAKTAAGDLFGDGITLNTICPGLHATDRIKELDLDPNLPVGDPRRFGQIVTFLCSEPAAFVNGAAVLVDGGRYLGLS